MWETYRMLGSERQRDLLDLARRPDRPTAQHGRTTRLVERFDGLDVRRRPSLRRLVFRREGSITQPGRP